ncbi:MAG: helix-turn-helix transcriptional regulator [Clostridium sp.]
MLFGDRVKQLREQAEMTQAELGKILGISDRVLSYYESNERFPRKAELILKLAEIFNVSTDYLIGTDGEMIQGAGEQYGSVGHKQAQGVLKNLELLFAGGELLEDDKDEVFRIVSELYFDAKKKNKEKYGRKK